ncbi:MAG: hypothetical protein COU33_02805, partial [Candidatus Magasanikbacteria bacterium CG10_big_fil_rev_8_21_14_0_10_43_6]
MRGFFVIFVGRILRMKRPHRQLSFFEILLFSVGIFLFFVFASASIFWERAYSATPPSIISYQGKLLENGSAVTTSKAMAFYLYDDLTAGTLLYSASGTLVATTTVTITPTSGIFSVDLGDTSGSPATNVVTSSIFANNASVYLEVWIDGTQMSPRKRLTSAPYALNAEYLMGATGSTGSTSKHIVISDANGNFTFSGSPQSSGVDGGPIYVNTIDDADKTLFGIAVGGAERFRVDNEGDTTVVGDLAVSSTLFVDVSTGRVGINSTSPDYALTVSGTSHFNATTTLTSLLNVQGGIASPEIVGTLTSGLNLGTSPGMVIQGDYAYITGSSTFSVVDISRPASPTLVGSYTSTTLMSGVRSAVAVRGSYAYVTSYSAGTVLVFDISRPSSPTLLTYSTDTNFPTSVALLGGYAFVPEGFGGGNIDVFDISNPGNVTFISQEMFGTNSLSITFSGKYLYLGDQFGQFSVVDASDPANLVAVSATSLFPDFSADVSDVFVSGKYAYIVGGTDDDELRILDISDPSSVTTTGFIVSSTSALLEGASSVYVANDYAYVASYDDDALAIIDISTPSSPQAVGSVSSATIDGAAQVKVKGNYAYVLGGLSGTLAIIDLRGSKISNSSIGNAEVANLQVFNDSVFDNNLHVRGGLSVGYQGLLLGGDLTLVSPSSTNASNTLRFSDTVYLRSSATTTASDAFVFDTKNTLTGGNLLNVRNNGTSLFVIDESGNVGVNSSSPSYNLTVVGTSYVSGTSTLGDTIISGDLNVDSGVLFVDVSTNRVGINSTTPAFDLAVNGTSKFTGTSTFSDLLTIQGRVKKPVMVGRVDPGGLAQNVFVQGDYAYVANSSRGLDIFDISYAKNPVLKGTVNPGGTYEDVVVSGQYAYLTNENGVIVVDVSNPSNPFFVATSTGSGGVAGGLDISGSYVYSIQATALEITDISHAAVPTNIADFSMGGSTAYDVTVKGNYAYVAQGVGGLQILDVSDPSNPFIVGSTDPGGTARSVTVVGKYAYIGNNDRGLDIIDISDPTAPTTTGNLVPAAGVVFDVVVAGDYAYLANFNDGVTIVDISSSTNPTVVIENFDLNDLGAAAVSGFFADGNNVYMALSGWGLGILDVSGAKVSNASFGSAQISNLSVRGKAMFDSGLYVRNGLQVGNNGLLVGGDFGIYAPSSTANATNTLRFSHTAMFRSFATGTSDDAFIFDTDSDLTAGNLLTIRENGTDRFVIEQSGKVGIGTSTPQYDLSVSGTSRFTGESSFGATTTIASNFVVEGRSAAPILISTTDFGAGSIYDLFVQGDYLYIPRQGDGLKIIDITDPTNIASTTEFNPAYSISGIFVSGNYAYVSGGNGEVHVLDVSNPSQVREVSQHTVSGSTSVTDLFVSGNYAYVDANDEGLVVLDIGDPENIFEVGRYISSSNGRDVDVYGEYAYFINVGAGLEVIDVSEPANPRSIATLDPGNKALLDEITVFNNYAFITRSGDAMAVIDISDPTAPVDLGDIDPAGSNGVNDIAVLNNYLYLVGSPNAASFQTYKIGADAANTTTYELLSTLDVGGADEIVVSGKYAYVVETASDELKIFDLSGANITNADIGGAKISALEVDTYAKFNGSVHIRNGLHVGNNGLLVGGDLSIYSNSTTANATNTVRFSDRVMFQTSASTSVSNLFIFDTYNSFPTTVSTTYLLSVRNNGQSAFSVASNGDVAASGTLYAANATVGTPGSPGDLAERVDIALDDHVESGDVMIVDPNALDTYRRSGGTYEQSIAGVISTNPTITVGNGRTKHTAVMAMIGRVPIKVSTENGPIRRGDILVSASIAGYAMRYDATVDNGATLVGAVGVALEAFDGEKGKILGLVRSGWMNNRNETIAGLQQDLIAVAEAGGVDIGANPADLQVVEEAAGGIGRINENLNLNGYYISNVAGLFGKNNAWEIDLGGRFITKVETSEGDTSLYALQSQDTEYIFSGSAALTDGKATIEFQQVTQDIIDPDQPIKVSITLTDDANGVYVSEKSKEGFSVKELLNGKSNATFDWVVIAHRNIDGNKPKVEEELLGEEPNDENNGGGLVPLEEPPVVPAEGEAPAEEPVQNQEGEDVPPGEQPQGEEDVEDPVVVPSDDQKEPAVVPPADGPAEGNPIENVPVEPPVEEVPAEVAVE